MARTSRTAPAKIVDPVNTNAGFALGPEQQQWIAEEQVVPYEGRDPGRPILRWSAGNTMGKKPGTLAPGGGVSPNNIDAANGRRGALKQTSEWKALMQRRLSPEDGGAFEEVIEGMLLAAKGSVKVVKYDCEECQHENKVTITDAPNPLAGKALIEFMIGRAPQYTEIDINARSLQVQLSELTEVRLSDFITVPFTEEEINERKRIVEATVLKDE